MNEIEKLYKKVGIEKDCIVMHECLSAHSKCENCSKTFYPDFTAKKQIELIKWLIVHSPNTCLEDEIIVSAFEDSLANIINTMWQDLNEEEHKQIKEILQ